MNAPVRRCDKRSRDPRKASDDSGKRQEIESLRFADKATLFTGEGDVDQASTSDTRKP